MRVFPSTRSLRDMKTYTVYQAKRAPLPVWSYRLLVFIRLFVSFLWHRIKKEACRAALRVFKNRVKKKETGNGACITTNAMTPHNMLLAAFCRNNCAITIFTCDLFEWRQSSFFSNFLEIVDFQEAAFLSSVCRSILLFKAKKWCSTWTLTSPDDLTLHAKPLQ